MKKVLTGLFVAVLVGATMAVAGTFIGGEVAKAHDSKDKHSHTTPAAQQTPAMYKYVAQSGDSYTEISRKAIQTYGKKHKVQVSLAGIVFAETNMTKEAGSPHLNVGQQVEISEEAIKKWVDQAQKLSDAQQTAWNYYVQFINFNTDNIGEAR